MPDRQLALEALSAIVGVPVKSVKEFRRSNPGQKEPFALCPQDVVDVLVGRSLMDYLPEVICQLELLSAGEASTEAKALRQEIFVDEEEFFDPQYDYDYTHKKKGAKVLKRGGEAYKRPWGWMRFAVKVSGKYKDGERWLQKGAHAWPVSYHGTSIEAAKGVIKIHYRPGAGQVYGRGIYSTPNLDIASSYSKIFTSRTTQKTYKVILQNRINPTNRIMCNEKDYWLVPIPKGTSAEKEKETVENSIRPYGLLLQEVQCTNPQQKN
ncbi:hypothetical protein AAFF_G00250420 [Aldrovandia affinis]|uniref:PARP catalytic domain-containing protein n=1 Tax=Aldrovandia affinis TaxID=143900 RepID=A0AAD7RD52_9TELE|nr:hypothetical protein AAFF_G00250420 [Aldrovandia affinis]